MKKRVFSGIQPSGHLHLGNYLGSIRNWVQDLDSRDNIFCVVDQHAITVDYDPNELRANVRELVGLYLACRLDPDKATLFVQSHIPEHTELAWLLTCVTPMGWLERMTQFKDKVGAQRERVGTGLFTYPTLMAADILLYHTHEVPVGDDQKQHVELTRDIAERFNRKFGDILTIPKPVIPKVGARIMGLDDPLVKMSKSAEGQHHSIGLLDDPAKVRKTIMRAVTDSQRDIVFDEARAGLFNLLSIYQVLTGQGREEIEAHFAGKGYFDFKKELAEVVIAEIEPIQARYREFTADPVYIDELLKKNVEKLRPIVDETMGAVHRAMGYR
jgi:tryptophanyl-tRNA synthetase